MRNEYYRFLGPLQFIYPRQALPLERKIADREHFIKQQSIELEVGGNCKAQPQIHSRRVTLYGHIKETSDLGKFHDATKLPGDLLARHAKLCAVQVDVLATRKLGVKTGAEIDQRRQAAADQNLASGRRCNPGKQLQHRTLTGAIMA